VHPSYINYHLKNQVSIMLCCQLCSTCYAAVRINKYLKSTSAIKVVTMKYTEAISVSITCNHQINTFSVSKDEWETKEGTGKSMNNALYIPWYAKGYLCDIEQ